MKVLVTGGAGFIGSHIAEALISAGHSVTIIDDLSMGRLENIPPKTELVQEDIRSERVRALFEKYRFDAVVHHAAQMDVRKSVDDPMFDASVNIVGSLNLLESCIRTGVRQFIFASTGGAIYGEQETFPATETHPTFPLSPYGVAKLAVEKYLYVYHEAYGLKYVSLRYANVYGPRQSPHGEAGVAAIFTEKMLAGGEPVINGDGSQTRDYVYVGDVVDANLRTLDYQHCGIFNVGTGVETDVNVLFRHLRELSGSGCGESHGEAKKGEQKRSVISSALIRERLGWRSTVELRDGLRETVASFKRVRGAK